MLDNHKDKYGLGQADSYQRPPRTILVGLRRSIGVHSRTLGSRRLGKLLIVHDWPKPLFELAWVMESRPSRASEPSSGKGHDKAQESTPRHPLVAPEEILHEGLRDEERQILAFCPAELRATPPPLPRDTSGWYSEEWTDYWMDRIVFVPLLGPEDHPSNFEGIVFPCLSPDSCLSKRPLT